MCVAKDSNDTEVRRRHYNNESTTVQQTYPLDLSSINVNYKGIRQIIVQNLDVYFRKFEQNLDNCVNDFEIFTFYLITVACYYA